MTRILILGGTREAAELAVDLVREGHDVTTSLAGRTQSPAPVAGAVRSGGFGGADGLAQWMIENRIEKLIDATHPYAVQISKNAQNAAALANIELQQHERSPWQEQTGDRWLRVETLEEAVDAIPTNTRAFLALGSQHLDPFFGRADVHFTIRMIDEPEANLPFAQHDIVLGPPSEDWREEAKLLRQKSISHLVSRNSGGRGAYAKIEAARELQLPVIMIDRPNRG